MKWTGLHSVLKDIDSHIEGDGYGLVVSILDGKTVTGLVDRSLMNSHVLIVSPPDKPPVYVDVDSIVAVTLES